MKKLLTLLLALSLLLSMTLLTACGGTEDFDDDEQKQEEENGDNAGGGSSSSDMGTREQAEAKLQNLGKTSGYEITLTMNSYGSESTVTSGVKGNVAWVYTGENSGSAIVRQSDTFFSMYSFNGDEWESTNNIVGTNADEAFDMYTSAFTMYIFAASTYADVMAKCGTETVAGRTCNKYASSENALLASASYSASIDKELGITMKWRVATSVAGAGSASIETEVTSFKTGAQVTVPDLPDPSEDYTDSQGLLGWPTNSYTALLPRLPGTVKYSAIRRGQFLASSEGVSEADFRAYVTALENRGFEGETDGFGFIGTDENGNEVGFNYDEGTLTVTLMMAE